MELNKNMHYLDIYGSNKKKSVRDLFPSYCTIILKCYTLSKNSIPFFDVGTEYLIYIWWTIKVIVSVRDSNVCKNHLLLWINYLYLCHVFWKYLQIIEIFPLVGDINYRHIYISIIFRLSSCKLPKSY